MFAIDIPDEVPVPKRHVILPLRILRWTARKFPWLMWNFAVKYCERMMEAPYGIGRYLLPTLNGKPLTDSLLDGMGMLSIFGWGIIWGAQLRIDEQGNKISAIPENRERVFVPTWRFGRIGIHFWNNPPAE